MKNGNKANGALGLMNRELLNGIGCAIIGLLLLIAPQIAEAIITTMIGVVILVVGLARVAGYFLAEKTTVVGSNELAMGLIWTVGGILFLTMGSVLFALLPVFLGCFVLFGACGKFQTAMNLYRMQGSMWKIEMIAAVIFALAGILILVNPFAVVYTLLRIAGAAILLDGIYGCFDKHMYKKTVTEYNSRP